MCKVINLFDNKNNTHEVKEESNDLGFKMSVEFDEEAILEYIQNCGYTKIEIKTRKMRTKIKQRQKSR